MNEFVIFSLKESDHNSIPLVNDFKETPQFIKKLLFVHVVRFVFAPPYFLMKLKNLYFSSKFYEAWCASALKGCNKCNEFFNLNFLIRGFTCQQIYSPPPSLLSRLYIKLYTKWKFKSDESKNWEVLGGEPSKMLVLVMCPLKTNAGIYWNGLHFCSNCIPTYVNIFLI